MEAAVGLAAGAGLGVFYFGALWLTVRRLPEAGQPGLLVFASYVTRLWVLGAGMYAVVRIGGATALLAALLALLVVRHLAVRRIAAGPDAPARSSDASEAPGRGSGASEAPGPGSGDNPVVQGGA